jgi:hypothetical protein
MFSFSYELRDAREWSVIPGLAVLVAEPSQTVAEERRRPVLRGLAVDPKILKVDIDTSEFVFEFGADNLKDVPVTLFVTH